MPFETGPFIQVACLCDEVIEDKNGVLSLIRIIDTVTRTIRDESPPDEMPPGPYATKLVLMIKSGSATGRHTLKAQLELPTGETRDPIILPVHLEGEEKGQNIVMNVNIILEMEGLHYFNIYFNEEKLGAIPFRVKYNPLTIGSTR